MSNQKGYRIIRQLNEELAAAGYMMVQAKVPRTCWSERFYFEKKYRIKKGVIEERQYPKIQKKAHGLHKYGWKTGRVRKSIKRSVGLRVKKKSWNGNAIRC